MKILVEGQFGHGAKKTSTWKKVNRPKLAMAPLPFDWVKGYSILDELQTISNFSGIPVKNQGTSGSCGGQASAYLMSTLEGLLEKFYEEKSAKSVYSRGYASGGGMTYIAIDNGLRFIGVAPERLVTSYDAGNPPDETFMEKTDWITPEIESVVKASEASGFVDIGMDFESIASAIRDHHGCIVGLYGENNGTWLSVNPQAPVNHVWAHWLYFCKAGLVNGKKTLWFINSWGGGVGQGGWQYITEEYVPHLMDVFAFVDEATPQKKNSLIQALAQWLKLKLFATLS